MKRRAVAGLLTMALAGCGSLSPFETAPPVLSDTGAASTAQQVAVCYNGLIAGEDALRAIAAQSCATKETLAPPRRDIDLDHCPLLTPERAIFTCPTLPPEPPRDNQE